MQTVKIHVINEADQRVMAMVLANHIPAVGDEIRLGGLGAERYYLVQRRVWAYDEETQPDRVNIGVVDA